MTKCLVFIRLLKSFAIPRYNSTGNLGLKFTLMNGKDYIKAKLVEDFGILNLDGTECITMGQYEEIVSAGDIGWLAKQSDKQFLIDELGGVTRELKGNYTCCIGNQYLMDKVGDVGVKVMKDGSGQKSQEMGVICVDVYDLDENLLISAESKNIILWDWLVDGDKFGVISQKGKKRGRLKLIDISGNIVTELDDDPNTSVVDVMMEEQKIILRRGIGASVPISEYDLTSQKVTDTEYGSENEWNSGIIMKKTGDFYQCYKEGELLFDERFADYSFDDGVLWLENTDSQWGIVDYDGKIIIPFGERGDRDSYTETLESDGNFGFYMKENGNYEFHNYVVAEGRIGH